MPRVKIVFFKWPWLMLKDDVAFLKNKQTKMFFSFFSKCNFSENAFNINDHHS